MRIYSIKDVVAGIFGIPFGYQHEIQAKRAFKKLLNDTSGTMESNKKEFELWDLGKFDEENGTIGSNGEIEFKGPKLIMKGEEDGKN